MEVPGFVRPEKIPARRTLDRTKRGADDLDAQSVVDSGQEFCFPGQHSVERIGIKGALAGDADGKPRQFHADARFFP